jgi:hypothetical protein
MFHRVQVLVDILVEFVHLFAQLLRLAICSLRRDSTETERARAHTHANTHVSEYVSRVRAPNI